MEQLGVGAGNLAWSFSLKFWSKVMMSGAEERPRLVMGGYGRTGVNGLNKATRSRGQVAFEIWTTWIFF